MIHDLAPQKPFSVILVVLITLMLNPFDFANGGENDKAKQVAAILAAKRVFIDAEKSEIVKDHRMAIEMTKAHRDFAMDYAAQAEDDIRSSNGFGLSADIKRQGSRAGQKAAAQDAYRLSNEIGVQMAALHVNQLKVARFWLQTKHQYLGQFLLIDKYFPEFFNDQYRSQVISQMVTNDANLGHYISFTAEDLIMGMKYAPYVMAEAQKKIRQKKEREAYSLLQGVISMVGEENPVYREAVGMKSQLENSIKKQEIASLWKEVDTNKGNDHLLEKRDLLYRLKDLSPSDGKVDKFIDETNEQINYIIALEYIEKARKYYRKKDYQNALLQLSTALNIKGKHSYEVEKLKAKIIQAENSAKIKSSLESARKKQKQGNWKGALEYARRVILLDQDNKKAQDIIDQAMFALKHMELKKKIHQLLSRHNSEGFIEKWAPGRWEETNKLIKKEEKFDITDPDLTEHYAKCRKKLDKAYLHALERAVEKAPRENIPLLAALIFSEGSGLSEKNREKAAGMFNSALGKSPALWFSMAEDALESVEEPEDRCYARAYLAWALHLMGRGDESLTKLKEGISELGRIKNGGSAVSLSLLLCDVAFEMGRMEIMKQIIVTAESTLSRSKMKGKGVWFASLTGRSLLTDWPQGTRRLMNAMVKHKALNNAYLRHTMLGARSLKGAEYYSSKSTKSQFTELLLLDYALKWNDPEACRRLEAAAQRKTKEMKSNTMDLFLSTKVQVRAAEGRMEDAASILERVTNKYLRDAAMEKMAAGYAKTGNFEKAEALLLQIGGDRKKAEAVLQVMMEKINREKITPLNVAGEMVARYLPLPRSLAFLGLAMGNSRKAFIWTVKPREFSKLDIVWGKYSKKGPGLSLGKRCSMGSGSSAYLPKGTIVTSINRNSVKSLADVLSRVLVMEPGEAVILAVKCKNCPSEVQLKTVPLSVEVRHQAKADPTPKAEKEKQADKPTGKPETAPETTPEATPEATPELADRVVSSNVFGGITGEKPEKWHWWACHGAYAASHYKIFKSWLKKNKNNKKYGYQIVLPKSSMALWHEFRAMAQFRPDVFLSVDERTALGIEGAADATNPVQLAKKYKVDSRFSELVNDPFRPKLSHDRKTANAILESGDLALLLGESPEKWHWWASHAAYAASSYKLFKAWLQGQNKKAIKLGFKGKPVPAIPWQWEKFQIVARFRPDVFLWGDERAGMGVSHPLMKVNRKKLVEKYKVAELFSKLKEDSM